MTHNLTDIQKINNQSFHALQFIAKNQNLFPHETIPTLLVLAAHLPNSFPTHELIKSVTGRSKRSIVRDIQKLEAMGVITLKKHFRNANEYRIDFSTLVDKLVDKSNLNSDTAMSLLKESNSATAMAPLNSRIVPNLNLNSAIAVSPQETNKKKYIKKTNIKHSFLDFLTNENFVKLIALHPKGNNATNAELEALYRTLSQNGEQIEPSDSEDHSTE